VSDNVEKRFETDIHTYRISHCAPVNILLWFLFSVMCRIAVDLKHSHIRHNDRPLILKEKQLISRKCRHEIVLLLKIDSLNILLILRFQLFRHNGKNE
jgi:hypothetical protein